jgi:hypothetical protein
MFTRIEWNLYTQCDVETHKCDYDTYECDFNTHKRDFYTQSVMLIPKYRIVTVPIVTICDSAISGHNAAGFRMLQKSSSL